jgi:hypothetical protein
MVHGHDPQAAELAGGVVSTAGQQPGAQVENPLITMSGPGDATQADPARSLHQPLGGGLSDVHPGDQHGGVSIRVLLAKPPGAEPPVGQGGERLVGALTVGRDRQVQRPRRVVVDVRHTPPQPGTERPEHRQRHRRTAGPMDHPVGHAPRLCTDRNDGGPPRTGHQEPSVIAGDGAL